MDVLKSTGPVLFSLAALACVPDLDSDESTVREPRVIAIQAEPAEAAPNAEVTYRALYVDQNGERKSGELSWFFCTAQKPLAELGPISQACLGADPDKLDRIGHGLTVRGTLPAAACSLFGPNPPPPVEDQPPGRPVDPDQTGGFKLPVMLGVDAGQGQDILLYEQRVACGLAGVTPKVSIEFNQRYHRNQNPTVSLLEVKRQSGAKQTLGEDEVLEARPSEKLTLSAGWPLCPASDVCGDGVCGPDETAVACAEDCSTVAGCGGQERYLWFDTERKELTVRREALRVAWFATAGSYDDERTGVDEAASSSRSDNGWTAPDEAQDLTLWLVLRDARGGVGFRELKVRVR